MFTIEQSTETHEIKISVKFCKYLKSQTHKNKEMNSFITFALPKAQNMITYIKDDSLKTMPKFGHRRVSKWIKQTAEHYIFCNDDKILEVNRQFLKHDYYTDVITFDYTENGVISGDVFISVDTVNSNSQKFGSTFDNEMMRVIIHGVLHLTGQNDKTPETEKQMRAKEEAALKELENID